MTLSLPVPASTLYAVKPPLLGVPFHVETSLVAYTWVKFLSVATHDGSTSSTTWTSVSENFIGWLDSGRYLQSNGPWNPAIVRVDDGV